MGPLKHPSTPTPSPIPNRDAFCACACHVHHRRVSQHIVYRGTNEVEKELFPPFSYLFLLLAVVPAVRVGGAGHEWGSTPSPILVERQQEGILVSGLFFSC